MYQILDKYIGLINLLSEGLCVKENLPKQKKWQTNHPISDIIKILDLLESSTSCQQTSETRPKGKKRHHQLADAINASLGSEPLNKYKTHNPRPATISERLSQNWTRPTPTKRKQCFPIPILSDSSESAGTESKPTKWINLSISSPDYTVDVLRWIQDELILQSRYGV